MNSFAAQQIPTRTTFPEVEEREIVGQRFQKMWYRTHDTMPFNPEWSNGTGYFDGAVVGEHAPKLEVGQMVASSTHEPDERKLLIIGTPLGNVVVFERYTHGRNDVYVLNCTIEFNRYIGNRIDRPINAEDMEFLIGDWSNLAHNKNVGVYLHELIRAMAEFKAESARPC